MGEGIRDGKENQRKEPCQADNVIVPWNEDYD